MSGVIKHQSSALRVLPQERISACAEFSRVCGYWCCHQQTKAEGGASHLDLIQLAPREYQESVLPKAHIALINTESSEEIYGYCTRKCFDQSSCSELVNFKPLDCRSYPFFPLIVHGRLELGLDTTRCPMAQDGRNLRNQYLKTHILWNSRCKEVPETVSWIANRGAEKLFKLIMLEDLK